MRSAIRQWLELHLPRLIWAVRSYKHRRFFRSTLAPFQAEIRGLLYPEDNIRVLTGPFMGMRYIDDIVFGSITPRWLGCYEAELHPVIAQCIATNYSRVIDLGCAEGYYAVGLARAMPAARIIAYDADFFSRRQTAALARLNGMKARPEIRSLCTHAQLESLAGKGTLLISDIEGAEADLLDPTKVSSLRKTDILVEVHEGAIPCKVEDLLCSRFKVSHLVQRIPVASRAAWLDKHHSELADRLSDNLLTAAARDGRPDSQVWLWFKTREH